MKGLEEQLIQMTALLATSESDKSDFLVDNWDMRLLQMYAAWFLTGSKILTAVIKKQLPWGVL